MKIRVLVLLAVFVLSAAAIAADFNGKWIAEVSNPMGGKSERIFVFKAAGDKLTGTVADWQVSSAVFEEKGKAPMTGVLKTQRGEPQQISEGKIAGDDVSFAIVSQGFMGETKTEYKGKIAGNEIKFTVDQGGGMGGMGGPGGGGPQEIVAKKAQ